MRKTQRIAPLLWQDRTSHRRKETFSLKIACFLHAPQIRLEHGPELAVASVAKSGKNIPTFVQAFIDGG